MTNDPRLIRVSDDEETWEGLLEVGSRIITKGDLVVVPTDTVYGVGCDPFNPSAVDRLFAAKRRGRDLPLPVLVHQWRQALGLVDEIDQRARALIAAYWPGPLTIVFRESPGIGWDLGAARGTVAVRMPKQPFTLALIRRTGPLAVTSANLSGQPTPATVPEIMRQLDHHVGVYYDVGPLLAPAPAPEGEATAGQTGDQAGDQTGGETEGEAEGRTGDGSAGTQAPGRAGPPSTIVDVTGPTVRVLREGAIPEADIHQVLEEAPADQQET